MDISSLSDKCIINIFYSVACFFILLVVPYDEKKFLILTKSNLSVFSIMVSTFIPI